MSSGIRTAPEWKTLAAVAEVDAALLGEAAVLSVLLSVLLGSRGLVWDDVVAILQSRHAAASR